MSKETEKQNAGCRSHGLFAQVKADPMVFAKRGDIFRGYYVVSRGVNYLTKDGNWTHGCTAPNDGNWWDTQPEAAHALEQFRKANVEVRHGAKDADTN